MQKILRNVCNIAVVVCNRNFICYEAVNLVQMLTVHWSLNDTFTAYVLAWLAEG